MTRHLSDEEIDRYRSRSVSVHELLAADDHLHVCDECYSRMGGAEFREPACRLLQHLVAHDPSRSDLVHEHLSA